MNTLSDPTFPEVTFAEAVFRVTALALKRLARPHIVINPIFPVVMLAVAAFRVTILELERLASPETVS